MKITFDQTTEDIMDLSRDSSRKNKLKFVIWGVVIVVLLTNFLPDLLKNDFSPETYIPFIIGSAIGGIIWLVISRGIKGKVLFFFGDKARMTGPREVELTEDELRIWTPDSATAYKWSAVSTLRKSEKSYFLYIGRAQAIIIPKRTFENEMEESEFLDFIESKIS